MIRKTLTVLAVTVPLVIAGCKTTEVAQRTSNPGSHAQVWVHNALLPGRVVIQYGLWTGDWSNWIITSASYQTQDDRYFECSGKKRRYREHSGPGALTGAGEMLMAASHRVSGDRWPVFYNPQTGRFHAEAWDERDGRWEVEEDGWVQEGWPRLMADACPGITEEILADGGWINEKQTHPTIWKMLEQDPTAPLVFPGAPPTTRLGLGYKRAEKAFSWCFTTNTRPVLPAHCYPEGTEPPGDGAALLLPESPDEAAAYLDRLTLADTLREANGNVLEDRLGRAYVLALGQTDEFWAVDGEDRLTDVGYLTWNAATETLELDWELKGDVADYHHRPGDPLPVVDTGRRHPAFAIADWLVGSASDVLLPYMGRQARFRFGDDGALTVRGKDRDFPGTWTVSRGRLVLEIDGIAERAGYPWDLLAGHLRATTGYTG
ncbi:MAG: hypothetical protein OXK73_03300 [Rhodospirillaceae bacterium]|nr:hypothetical protein [Rhodospirillaceae bacterium]